MIIARLKPKELKRKYGGEVYAFTSINDLGKPVVYLPKRKVPIRVRLHEMYHARNILGSHFKIDRNHKICPLYNWALEELRAEEFACLSRGKKLNTNNVDDVAYTLITQGNKPSPVMSAINKSLDMMGLELTDEMKSDLWWSIKGYYHANLAI